MRNGIEYWSAMREREGIGSEDDDHEYVDHKSGTDQLPDEEGASTKTRLNLMNTNIDGLRYPDRISWGGHNSEEGK